MRDALRHLRVRHRHLVAQRLRAHAAADLRFRPLGRRRADGIPGRAHCGGRANRRRAAAHARGARALLRFAGGALGHRAANHLSGALGVLNGVALVGVGWAPWHSHIYSHIISAVTIFVTAFPAASASDVVLRRIGRAPAVRAAGIVAVARAPPRTNSCSW